MPPYRLRDDLSFARVEGHLVFLDVDNDQYFQLPKARECAFLAYVEGGTCEEGKLRDLLKHNILTVQTPISHRIPRSNMRCPTRSALEGNIPKRTITVTASLGVFSDVCSTQFQLKARRLKAVLQSLAAYRSAHTSRSPHPSSHPTSEQLASAAALFRHLRLLVPINTCCLLDSIALIRFLARRSMHANLVFGVTGDPFSAHCWVQVDELVLNDTLGNANAYTPIRTV